MAISQAISRDRFNMPTATALLAFVVICAVTLFPIFSHQFISLNDVYNHIARAPVLAHYNDVPAFRQYWIPNWRLVPYIGFDLVALGLLPWFSLGVIVKLIVAGTILSMLAGAMLLSRAVQGRWTAVTLTGALLLLNRTLLAGFVNYLFGIGVSLLGAAAWIAMRQRGAPLRVIVLALFAVTLCAIHLFACGVLGVIVGGIELAELMQGRFSLSRFLTTCLQLAVAFLPAFLLVVFVAPHPGFHIVYGDLKGHLAAFAVPLTYAPIEEAIGLVLVAIVILGFAVTGRLHIDRRLAVAAGLLALVQMVIPSEVGTATVVDHRIPIAFWLVFVCALDIRAERAWLAAGLVALLGVVFISRVAIIQTRWTQENVVYNAADQAFASLPGTARVATAYPATGLNEAANPLVALYYMPALAFVPRGGFTQILWTIPDQHPLIMRPAFQQLTNEAPPELLWQFFVTQSGDRTIQPAEIRAAVEQYDYIAFINADPFQVSPMNLLEPVRQGPGLQIYRVRHNADTAAAKPNP